MSDSGAGGSCCRSLEVCIRLWEWAGGVHTLVPNHSISNASNNHCERLPFPSILIQGLPFFFISRLIHHIFWNTGSDIRKQRFSYSLCKEFQKDIFLIKFALLTIPTLLQRYLYSAE